MVSRTNLSSDVEPETKQLVMEGLDALWSQYANKWRRLLSRKAMTELSLRASFDVDLIDPKKVANDIPKGSVPECSNCEDICCRGIENLVSLRLRDIALLMDIDRTDLMTKQKPRFPKRMMETRPALYELMGSELWLSLPVLRQLGESRLCAALTSEMQCGIYPNWPLSCDRFPYTLVSSPKKVVWGTRCPHKKREAETVDRSAQLFEGAVLTYNERIRDAVLLAHARPQLDALGIGRFLSDPRIPEFEEERDRLPLYFE